MKKWFSKFLAETTPQGRNAFRVAAIGLVTILFSFPLFIYAGMQTGAWQVYVLLAGLVASSIIVAFSAWFARRNRVGLAVSLVIGAAILLTPLYVALLSGLGLTLSISNMLIVAVITGQTLSGRQASRALLIGAVSSVVMLLEDLYAPWNRLSIPFIQSATPFMMSGIVAAMGFFVIWQFKTYSLRSKLLVSVIGLTVLSVGTLAGVNYYNSRVNLTTTAGNGLKALANSQAAAISDTLTHDAQVLESFGLSKIVQDRVDKVNAAYGANEAFNLQQIQIIDQQWRAAANDSAPVVAPVLDGEVASELREFTETFPQNTEVFVTDRYGALVAATNRTSDYYQADEEWWQAAYNHGHGDFYLGQPEFDESSKTFGIIMAVPLFEHGTNKVNGVLRTTLTLDSVIDILRTNSLGKTGHAELYLPHNLVLAPENAQSLETADLEVLAHLSSLVNEQTFASFKYEGAESVVSAALVASTDAQTRAAIQNLNWKLVAHQDAAANLAPVSQQTRSILLIALVILGLSAAASVLLSQTLTGPIVRLTEVAEKVTAGDITVQARVESSDEIGTLAGSFNKMTSQLHDLIGSLEQRVADRTKDLEQSLKDLDSQRYALDQHSIVAITDVTGKITYANDKFVEISKYAREELIGQDHRILNSGYHSKEFIRNLWVTIANGKAFHGELCNRAKDGSIYWVDTTIVPFLNSQGKPYQYVAIRTDITQRKKDEEALAKRALEMETVSKVSTAAATILDVQELLQTVVDLTKANFGLYHAHIYLMNEKKNALVLAAGAGEVGRQMVEQKRVIEMAQKRSLVVQAALTGNGQIANDVTQEPDFLPNPLLPETQSEMAIPMSIGNEVIGIFDVQSNVQHHFTDEDVRIQTALASQVAVALQNARSFVQAQRQAERESMLNLVNQKIQNAATVEAVLQIAAREISEALKSKNTRIVLKDIELANARQTNS